jgi:hypothetical protein
MQTILNLGWKISIRRFVIITLRCAPFFAALNFCATPARAMCNSGPDYCIDDPRIPDELASKKKRLSREYPPRLIALLDRGVQCVARIETSPDGFSMVIVKADAGIDVIAWDQDNENAAKEEILAGTVKRFWIVNSRRAFSCDGQASYDRQNDYNTDDDVNMSTAIKCGDGNQC